MKRSLSIFLMLGFLLVPGIAFSDVCSHTINVKAAPLNKKIDTIVLALKNYHEQQYLNNGRYELCFDMVEQLIDDNQIGKIIDGVEFKGAFVLDINANETIPVYVQGLKLKRNFSAAPVGPLLKINNASTNPITVTLNDISLVNVIDGLALEGNNKITVQSSSINGDAQLGTCIDVKSPGAVLEGVTAKHCATGVQIGSSTALRIDNVRIVANSDISEDKIGVHISGGALGTDIERSRIYMNDDGDALTPGRLDGIKIDDNFQAELMFYDVKDGKISLVDDGDTPINYADRTAYMMFSVPQGQEVEGKLEFFVSFDNATCNSKILGQMCGLFENIAMPLEIAAKDLKNGPVGFTIPAEYLNKTLVVVYTHPVLGTTGISRQFLATGPVAIIANPYDIPTQGETGTSTDDQKVDNTLQNSAGGDGVSIEGTGNGLAAAAPHCNLMIGDTFRTVAWGINLWWLLLAASLLGALRTVAVRIRHRRDK